MMGLNHRVIDPNGCRSARITSRRKMAPMRTKASGTGWHPKECAYLELANLPAREIHEFELTCAEHRDAIPQLERFVDKVRCDDDAFSATTGKRLPYEQTQFRRVGWVERPSRFVEQQNVGIGDERSSDG